MEKVEEDLKRSRSLREKQAKEFSQQLDDLRQKFEQQVCEFLTHCAIVLYFCARLRHRHHHVIFTLLSASTRSIGDG